MSAACLGFFATHPLGSKRGTRFASSTRRVGGLCEFAGAPDREPGRNRLLLGLTMPSCRLPVPGYLPSRRIR